MKSFAPFCNSLLLSGLLLCACSQSHSTVEKSPVVPPPRAIIYRSADQGKTWQALVPDLPAAAQVSFMEPLGTQMIVATDNQGLFVSQDDLQGWQPIGQTLPNAKINALHTRGADIWVGVYNEGLFHRAAAAETWTALNEGLPNLRVQSILMDETLLAGTDIGVFSLDPRTRQWTTVLKGVQVLSLARLGQWVIAGTSQGTYRSADHGQSWRSVHNQGAVHYTQVVGDKIVELYLSGDVYLSEDQGESFYAATYQPREASYVYEMVALGDTLVMSNNYGIHQSIDAGHTWRLVYQEESLGFFDLLVKDGLLYGGTRIWDEYRGR